MNQGKRRILAALAITLFGSFSTEADARASGIIKQIDEGEKSSSSTMTFKMVINSSDGGAPREFMVQSMENAEGDSHVAFMEPRTIRGMRILSKGSSSLSDFRPQGIYHTAEFV